MYKYIIILLLMSSRGTVIAILSIKKYASRKGYCLKKKSPLLILHR